MKRTENSGKNFFCALVYISVWNVRGKKIQKITQEGTKKFLEKRQLTVKNDSVLKNLRML